MVGGFNNNFRYRGILFHVQTEDSGVAKPHVTTHLFHGGDILASEKRDYSEKLDLAQSELEGVVRGLMESQHKAMHRRVKRGLHDRVILERLGAEAVSEAPACERSETEAQPVAAGEAEMDTHTEARVRAKPAPSAMPSAAEPMRGFGQSVVSQKPLDEVVLEYLVENARKRKRKNR
jgi:hypothetical protein